MKILILSDYSPTWNESPPSRLLHLAREFSRRGHEVRVVGSQTDSPAAIDGVEIVTLSFGAYGGVKQGSFAFRKEIRHQVRWCDALIVRGYWIGLWALLYAAISGVNVRMCDFHGYACKEQFFERRLIRSIVTFLIEMLGLYLSTSILAVSKGVKNDLSLCLQRRAIIVENGIYLEQFLSKPSIQQTQIIKKRFNLSENKPLYTVVASFGPWLNMMEVIRAASQVKNIADVMVIGYGPGIEEAKRELQSVKTENVYIAGKLSHNDVITILCGLSYGFLCPYDGQWLHSQEPNFFASRKVKEYLAAGRPILVSDIRGRGDFLIDGKTCMLYRSNNSNSLAEKMKELVLHPDFAERIGKNGRKIAENFTWTRICKDSGLLKLLEKE